MANKVKTISFRVDETTYNKYSELAEQNGQSGKVQSAFKN